MRAIANVRCVPWRTAPLLLDSKTCVDELLFRPIKMGCSAERLINELSQQLAVTACFETRS